jgi:hypothetical protein
LVNTLIVSGHKDLNITAQETAVAKEQAAIILFLLSGDAANITGAHRHHQRPRAAQSHCRRSDDRRNILNAVISAGPFRRG